MRIREIAQSRVRYGYRKIRALLNREGWNVGKYLVCRLYKEEGLTLSNPHFGPVLRSHIASNSRPADMIAPKRIWFRPASTS
jgi:HTH-like domain